MTTWHRDQNLLYTLKSDGFRKGKELYINEDMIRVEGPNSEEIIQTLIESLSENLIINELLEALVYARRFLNEDDHDVDFIDTVIKNVQGEA